MALLALPEALVHELPAPGTQGTPRTCLAAREGTVVLALPSLARAAEEAKALLARHPGTRLGLDYGAIAPGTAARVDPSGHVERALTLASADLKGAIALDKAAALALTLEAPGANVEPMGSIRGAVGEFPICGLFPDRRSDDQLGE